MKGNRHEKGSDVDDDDGREKSDRETRRQGDRERERERDRIILHDILSDMKMSCDPTQRSLRSACMGERRGESG